MTVPTSNVRIMVTSLTRNLTTAHLEEIFSTYGKVADVWLPLHPPAAAKLNKGYAFIEFAHPESAQNALDFMDGGQVDGRQVQVSWARERPKPLAPREEKKENSKTAPPPPPSLSRRPRSRSRSPPRGGPPSSRDRWREDRNRQRRGSRDRSRERRPSPPLRRRPRSRSPPPGVSSYRRPHSRSPPHHERRRRSPVAQYRHPRDDRGRSDYRARDRSPGRERMSRRTSPSRLTKTQTDRRSPRYDRRRSRSLSVSSSASYTTYSTVSSTSASSLSDSRSRSSGARPRRRRRRDRY